MFSKTKYSTILEDEAIYTKIKNEKLSLEIEEINIKKAELELKKKKIEYETKKFQDKIKQEFKKEKGVDKTKKQEQKYFKEHKYKFKKILEELVVKYNKKIISEIISEFISYKLKKSNCKFISIKKKSLLQEFNDWFKLEYNSVRPKVKMPQDIELYECMTKKFGLPHSTKGWIGVEFIRDEEEDNDVILPL